MIDAKPDMAVTFTLEPRDLRACYRYLAKHHPAGRRLRLIMVVLVAAYSLAEAIRIEGEDTTGRIIYFFVTAIFCYAIWRILTFLLTTLAQARSLTPEKQKGVLCEHTIVLREDALTEVTAFNEARNLWSGVYKVVNEAKYIYIFMGPIAAHIIPKRAFIDMKEADAFFERATELHAASQQVGSVSQSLSA